MIKTQGLSLNANGPSSHPIVHSLHQASTYLAQIQRLKDKLIETNRLYDTTQNGVNYYQFCMHDNQLAKILANEIKNERYQYQPAKPRTITTKNKQRIIYHFCPTDRIVQSALHQTLSPYVVNLISPDVYSYIPGRSNHQAAQRVAHYLKQKNAVYAIRCDIVAYTDNIPTSNHSLIWKQFNQLIQLIAPNRSIPNYIQRLITDSIRPIIQKKPEQPYQMMTGLPQGAPMTTIAANLYLQPIDSLLNQIPEGCYARFGDDLLFLHTNKHVLLEVEDLLNKQLSALGLFRNQQKDGYHYLTSNGRHEPATEASTFRPCQSIDFLGFQVNTNGTIGLSRQTHHRLIRELRQRIKNTVQLTTSQKTRSQANYVCSMLNRNFETFDFLTEPRLKQLLNCCTDRQQLKNLDYLIALSIAEQISGHSGPRAFRSLPYKTLRNDCGLRSLCKIRNKI